MDNHTDDFLLQDPSLILTHYGEEYERYEGAVVPPVYMNSLNVFPRIEDYYSANPLDDPHAFVYGRVSNPTVAIAERKIAALEHGAWAALFASGMAAASAAISACCTAGCKVVCVRNAYGPVKNYLERIGRRAGIRTEYVKGEQLAEFEQAVTDDTALVMLESPSTAIFSLQDIAGVCAIAHRHGARVYIDNTYCTPLYQNPLELGVDLVMHTASKYLGGHSDLIGGVLAGRDEALRREIFPVERELIGGIIGPMEAWLIIRGMRTMEVRLERHSATALRVAQYLEAHPRVRCVHYPQLESHPQRALARRQQRGSSGLLSFELDGTPEQACAVVDALRLFHIGVSWGGFESLACMPHLHQSEEELALLGGGRGLVRLHCGLETAALLLEDLEQALARL